MSPYAAMAQIDPPPTYAGDLWSRPRLTDDWFGGRDWLAKRGVTFDLDLNQVLHGVGSGGVNDSVCSRLDRFGSENTSNTQREKSCTTSSAR